MSHEDRRLVALCRGVKIPFFPERFSSTGISGMWQGYKALSRDNQPTMWKWHISGGTVVFRCPPPSINGAAGLIWICSNLMAFGCTAQLYSVTGKALFVLCSLCGVLISFFFYCQFLRCSSCCCRKIAFQVGNEEQMFLKKKKLDHGYDTVILYWSSYSNRSRHTDKSIKLKKSH